MAQQTAVSWLHLKIQETYDKEGKLPLAYTLYLVEQAKQMEKEQILDAYEQGAIDGRFEMFSDNTVHNAEAYYNKTFND